MKKIVKKVKKETITYYELDLIDVLTETHIRVIRHYDHKVIIPTFYELINDLTPLDLRQLVKHKWSGCDIIRLTGSVSQNEFVFEFNV